MDTLTNTLKTVNKMYLIMHPRFYIRFGDVQ